MIKPVIGLAAALTALAVPARGQDAVRCPMRSAVYEAPNGAYSVAFHHATAIPDHYPGFDIVMPGTASVARFAVDAGNDAAQSAFRVGAGGGDGPYFFYAFDDRMVEAFGGAHDDEPAPRYLFFPRIEAMVAPVVAPGGHPALRQGMVVLHRCAG